MSSTWIYAVYVNIYVNITCNELVLRHVVFDYPLDLGV